MEECYDISDRLNGCENQRYLFLPVQVKGIPMICRFACLHTVDKTFKNCYCRLGNYYIFGTICGKIMYVTIEDEKYPCDRVFFVIEVDNEPMKIEFIFPYELETVLYVKFDHDKINRKSWICKFNLKNGLDWYQRTKFPVICGCTSFPQKSVLYFAAFDIETKRCFIYSLIEKSEQHIFTVLNTFNTIVVNSMITFNRNDEDLCCNSKFCVWKLDISSYNIKVTNIPSFEKKKEYITPLIVANNFSIIDNETKGKTVIEGKEDFIICGKGKFSFTLVTVNFMDYYDEERFVWLIDNKDEYCSTVDVFL